VTQWDGICRPPELGRRRRPPGEQHFRRRPCRASTERPVPVVGIEPVVGGRSTSRPPRGRPHGRRPNLEKIWFCRLSWILLVIEAPRQDDHAIVSAGLLGELRRRLRRLGCSARWSCHAEKIAYFNIFVMDEAAKKTILRHVPYGSTSSRWRRPAKTTDDRKLGHAGSSIRRWRSSRSRIRPNARHDPRLTPFAVICSSILSVSWRASWAAAPSRRRKKLKRIKTKRRRCPAQR